MPPRSSARVAARPKKQAEPAPAPPPAPTPSPPAPALPLALPPALPPSLPLAGCDVALCGTFSIAQAALRDTLKRLGARSAQTITQNVTHLIASDANCRKPTAKVREARAMAVPVVSLAWLQACEDTGARADETLFVPAPLQTATAAPSPPAPSPPPPPAPSPPPAPPAPKTKERAKRTASPPPPASAPEPKKTKTAERKTAAANGGGQGPEIFLPNTGIHVDEDGVVCDASLNQTNAGNNNNKFYKIQILRNGRGAFAVWTGWGRVGENGQSAMEAVADFDAAVKLFGKKFRQKTGLAWTARDQNPLPGKYAYVERSYEEPEADDDNDGGGDADTAADEAAAAAAAEAAPPPPKCTLAPPVQQLVELIFDRALFAANMAELNYDANKLPLGRLSAGTIRRGYQALKDLAALLDDPAGGAAARGMPYAAAVEQLSNLYYSVIPHAFGRNRPPVIGAYAQLKREVELLDSLSDMKDAQLRMEVEKKAAAGAAAAQAAAVHPADRLFRGLGLREMTALDPAGAEYAALAEYLHGLRGQTHGHVRYAIDAIFRVVRAGERERFDACTLGGSGDGGRVQPDTRLLWHGSRTANFGGILGQGLRIAPPEAPVSGYMFGKGIYLADLSTKSAGYCCPGLSAGTGLLLLCAAKLGTPLQTLDRPAFDAGDTAREKGLYATLGQGTTEPLGWKDAGCVHKDLAGVLMPDVSKNIGSSNKPSAVAYNEYIVYDEAQVCLRYLFRVRMQ